MEQVESGTLRQESMDQFNPNLQKIPVSLVLNYKSSVVGKLKLMGIDYDQILQDSQQLTGCQYLESVESKKVDQQGALDVFNNLGEEEREVQKDFEKEGNF